MEREVCWHCLHCHWYCDDVLEECRGQPEPCHEFKLCMEFEDRLVNVNDVIEAVDKHTREDGTLDEDISVILEEVETAFDKDKTIDQLKEEGCIIDDEAGNRAVEIIEKGGLN